MHKQRVNARPATVALSALLSLAFIAGAFISIATAPVAGATSPTGVPKNATTDNYLHVGMQDEPKSLNPVIPNDEWSSKFLDRIWDNTLARDPDDGCLYPWIAMDWRMDSADNKNITVTYRIGKWDPNSTVKFHDGHPVDIYDLLFSYAVGMNVPRWSSKYDAIDRTPNGTMSPPNDPTPYPIPMIKGIWMDSDPAKQGWTLHFRMNRTDASWEMNLVNTVIYPSHLWGEKFSHGVFNSWNIENEANPAKYVVGTGAFKYGFWVKGSSQAQLDTFAEYFPWNRMPRDANGNKPALKDGATEWHWETKVSPITVDPSQQKWGDRPARPNIDGIKFHIYYSEDTAILALQNGEADINWWPVEPGYISQMQSNPNVGLVSSEDTGFFYMAFNMRKPSFGYDDWNSPNRIDRGKAFRIAATMCTDKDTIVKRLLMNYGSPGTSVISPSNTEWYNPNVRTYPYDPEGAEKILDDAGMTVGASGWRNLGGDIGEGEFELIHPPSDYSSTVYGKERMIVEQLRAIKIHIVSKHLQLGELVQRINNRSFDCYCLGWRLGFDPDYMFDFFHSSTAGAGLRNYPGYHNDYYDQLMEKERMELNRSKQHEMIKEAQAIIAEDLPYNVLYYRANIEAYRQDHWAGWIKLNGDIMNSWSFMFIHKPRKLMQITPEFPQAMTEGCHYSLNIKLREFNTTVPISGASVTLKLSSSGYGDVGILENDTVISDYTGFASFSFTAPSVNDTTYNRSLLCEILVVKDGYELSRGFVAPTVFADSIVFHTATIDSKNSVLTIRAGESGTVRVLVKTQKMEPVSNVTVIISAEPSDGISFKTTEITTDAAGRAIFSYSGETKGNYTISVRPIKGVGVLSVYGDTDTVCVMDKQSHIQDETPWLGVTSFIISIIVGTAIIVQTMYSEKKKKS